MASLETEIQNSIIDYLKYKKIFCWRNQSIGVFDAKNNSFRRLPKHAITGVSDILGILPDGRFLAIEVKSKTGTVSSNQKVFITNVNDSNGLAFVARSIDDVQEFLNGL